MVRNSHLSVASFFRFLFFAVVSAKCDYLYPSVRESRNDKSLHSCNTCTCDILVVVTATFIFSLLLHLFAFGVPSACTIFTAESNHTWIETLTKIYEFERVENFIFYESFVLLPKWNRFVRQPDNRFLFLPYEWNSLNSLSKASFCPLDIVGKYIYISFQIQNLKNK